MLDRLQTSISKLQSRVSDPESDQKFGTFAGVFTPIVLTILGAIMYLRLGQVVGRRIAGRSADAGCFVAAKRNPAAEPNSAGRSP